MNLYPIFLHAHSGLRWLVLIFIIIAIVNAAMRLKKGNAATCGDCSMNRLAMIAMHLQLLIGLVLYFISPKVVFEAASMQSPMLRFFLVEHIILMVAAVVLITIGYVKSDRAGEDRKKHRAVIIYYSISLFLILISIPWPFRGFGSGWF
jgi:cytochrome c biogenesis factor